MMIIHCLSCSNKVSSLKNTACLNTTNRHFTVKVIKSCCKSIEFERDSPKIMDDKNFNLSSCTFSNQDFVDILPGSGKTRDNRGINQERSTLVDRGSVGIAGKTSRDFLTHNYLKNGPKVYKESVVPVFTVNVTCNSGIDECFDSTLVPSESINLRI